MQTTTQDHQALMTDCLDLIEASQTLLLSTCSEKLDPDISYAPYVREGLAFYVYVSELARHTGNMLKTMQASVMFIQPEVESANLFARKRVIFNCRAQKIARAEALYELQLQAMQSKFGETVELLRSLNDFHLLQLRPERGHYIAGFGKSFALDIGTLSLTLITHAN